MMGYDKHHHNDAIQLQIGVAHFLLNFCFHFLNNYLASHSWHHLYWHATLRFQQRQHRLVLVLAVLIDCFFQNALNLVSALFVHYYQPIVQNSKNSSRQSKVLQLLVSLEFQDCSAPTQSDTKAGNHHFHAVLYSSCIQTLFQPNQYR